ncbi:hypothetical protein F66182_6191 [Fusarium sp. NRRL 66182]|nr:hypothetical protein F66182_6191 [Fusarium sp. NRRL 66182]
MSDEHNHLAESGVTVHSDSELYSAGDELSSPPSSNSPVILYKPPTAWSLIRGAAINLLLPFINGMMLGFGELFAHETAFRLGWGGTKVFPLTRRRAHPIGPGIELQEKSYSPRPSLNDIASLELVTSQGPMTRVPRPSATDYREPDFYPPVPGIETPKNSHHQAIIHSTHLTTAAMLPSRGIMRPLPSGAFQRPLCGQPISSRTLGRKLGDARQFGTALRNSRAPLTAGTRVGVKSVAAPLVLGGISSARTISIWGWGWGGKKTEEPIAEATTSTPEAPTPPETIQPVTTAYDAANVPSEFVADATQAAEPSSVVPSDFDLAEIAKLDNPNILNMPETLGFLREIGLDYGWGPTSVMQWLLEHVHVYTGLGWGGSIIATAFLLRAIMFYPQIRSLRFNAAMNQMKKDPRSEEAMNLLKKGFQTGDREMQQKGQFLGQMVRQQYGAQNSGMLWSFVQIPFSFGLFRIISGMVHIPVPSLENAGFLWFTDLTASDPYFLLPAIGTSLLFGAMMVNSKYTPASQKAMLKKMMWVFGTVGFIGTTFLSAGVNLMMVSTGSATLVTALVLNNETVRRALNLPILEVEKPKYVPPRPTQSSGLGGLRERLTENLNDAKKGLSDQVSNYTGQVSGTAEDRAEKKRKDQMRKLEEMRRKLERDEFEKKYKR